MAVILGSGLGGFSDRVKDAVEIPYSEIPGFPVSSVQGHAGRLFSGTVRGKKIIVLSGRAHHYEGFSPEELVFPVRALKFCGVKILIITNAAGGINRTFSPGDLMAVSDHINLMGFNPLRGGNIGEIGARFPDMSFAYSKRLRELFREAAAGSGAEIREGVYLALSGPSYETPAEIRALAALGADAVGMSTVPEVIAAVHAGMEVFAVSCITNLAAGISSSPLSHEEVEETGERVKEKFSRIMEDFIGRIAL